MNEKSSESNAVPKQLDWPTVILIIVTGGGNFLAGQQGKKELSYEQQEALAKIRQIHENLDNFETGMNASLNNQAQILNNQSLMLEDQAEILKQLKIFTEERRKELDRGVQR